jgi:hypothetical protein
VLDIFENVRVLTYADKLKLYMRVSSTDDCFLFQQFGISMNLTRTRRCMWLLSGQVWSMHRACGQLIKSFVRLGLSAFNTTL